jgi:hypothetical protein
MGHSFCWALVPVCHTVGGAGTVYWQYSRQGEFHLHLVHQMKYHTDQPNQCSGVIHLQEMIVKVSYLQAQFLETNEVQKLSM